jgi:hypothetical protein
MAGLSRLIVTAGLVPADRHDRACPGWSSWPSLSRLAVMAGLVPAIHVFLFRGQAKQDVDARHKAGHDGDTDDALGTRRKDKMQITAAVVRERAGPFVLEPIELDDPRPGEVLVQVAASGMCHTDLHGRDGYYGTPFPAVFGHEGAGRVLAVGSGVKSVATR